MKFAAVLAAVVAMLVPAAANADDGDAHPGPGYHFIYGQPNRWNPCAGVITYSETGNAKSARTIDRVFHELTTLTGLTFQRVPEQANIAVTYVTGLAATESFAGVATDHATTDGWIDHSDVRIDSTFLMSAINRTGKRRSIYRHELGHAMGLGHTSDSDSVMQVDQIASAWGVSDRDGLARLGASQGCTRYID